MNPRLTACIVLVHSYVCLRVCVCVCGWVGGKGGSMVGGDLMFLVCSSSSS